MGYRGEGQSCGIPAREGGAKGSGKVRVVPWVSASTSTQGILALLTLPQDLMDRCQQSVQEHCTFCYRLLELQQWVAVVTQTLESHQADAGLWDAKSQEAEVEVRWPFVPSPASPKPQ
jgi:hypothetical protein